MFNPRTPYTKIAFETIKCHLEGGDALDFDFEDIPGQLYEIRRGCFVSLHQQSDELRGCIGTLEPHEVNLVAEIRRNALSAAFHDHRFSPLSKDEFPGIKISVDVLTPPERISSLEELDPEIYGLIITDGKIQRGVLLPSVPGIDSIERQIEVVKRKAGLSKADDRLLEYYRFTSSRYH